MSSGKTVDVKDSLESSPVRELLDAELKKALESLEIRFPLPRFPGSGGKTVIKNVTLQLKHNVETQWKAWGIWAER